MRTLRELTAPCGLDCFNCDMYEENLTGERRDALSLALEIPKESVGCKGCRASKGKRLGFESCATLECAGKKKVEFCFPCAEFPCSKLQPAADGADSDPHNMKLFNLCRMKAVGVDRWATEEAPEIRRRYFHGSVVAGQGVVMKPDPKA